MTWMTLETAHLGEPTAIAAAQDEGQLVAIGFEHGRGLLITRTGGR